MAARCVAIGASSGFLPLVCFSKPEHVFSANVRRHLVGLEQSSVLTIAPAFNRRTARLPSICRRAGAPGDDDKEIERGEYEYPMTLSLV